MHTVLMQNIKCFKIYYAVTLQGQKYKWTSASHVLVHYYDVEIIKVVTTETSWGSGFIASGSGSVPNPGNLIALKRDNGQTLTLAT